MIRYNKKTFAIISLSFICVAFVYGAKRTKNVSAPVSFKEYPVKCVDNGLGKPKSYAFANGALISFRYDKSGRLIKLTWPDQSFVIYRYSRNLISEKLESGRTTNYEYDDFGRMVKKVVSQEGSVLTETRTYDSKGNLTSVCENGKSIITFIYDRYGRKLIETGPSGIIKYLYDRLGRLAIREVKINDSPTKFQTYFGYDGRGRIARITSPSGRFIFTWSKKFKKLSRIEMFLSKTFMQKKQPSYVIQNKFDNEGRHVSKYITINSNNTEKFSYIKYNEQGQITQLESFDIEWNYQYNEFNRLVSAKNNKGLEYKYSYDSVGNCIPDNDLKLSYDNMWRINSPGYRYDTYGNLVESPGIQYKYDLKNRLIEKKTKTKITRYQYDPLDQITSCEITDLINPTKSMKTNYLMSDMIEYASYSGGVAVYHTYTPNVIDKVNRFKNLMILLASTRTNNRAVYYLTGMDNNVIADFDTTQIKVKNKVFYSPFGKVHSYNQQIPFPLGFKSMFSPDGSLYYYKGRFYDPELLCYLTLNPVLGKEGNPYLFVNNNPIGMKKSFIELNEHDKEGHLDFPLKPDLKDIFNLKNSK